MPRHKRSRKPARLLPKARLAREEKKKALRPKPESGNAVAVPLLSGQLYVAAKGCQNHRCVCMGCRAIQVLIAAEKAQQLPRPVKKAQKLRMTTGIMSGP